MKLIFEIESLSDARIAVVALQRAFPEAWQLLPQQEETDAPGSAIVAADGSPAAAAPAQTDEKPARVREKRSSKMEEKKAEPVPAPVTTGAPQPRLEDVRAAARTVRTPDGTPNLTRVREILTKFGATRIDGLKVEQFEAFITACVEKPEAGSADIGL